MFAQAFLERCALIPRQSANSKQHSSDAARANCHVAPHISAMSDFDYRAPAEVFACRSRGSSPRPVTYRRFESGAEAVRFAIEELPSDVLFGTVLEVNEQRFDAAQIRKLYDSKDYPLQRRDMA
jgi:hypothetical protein